MRKILILLGLLLSVACSNESVEQVLIVTGGHDYDSTNFIRAFNSFEDLKFDQLVQPEANEIYSSDSIGKYDALIFYDMVQDITEDQKKAFINLLNEGQGMVFLHHSIASYQDWDEFLNILGARYYLQPSVYKNDSVPASTYLDDQEVEVSVLDDMHPVTRGLEDFTIQEEVYDYYTVIPGVHPLMSTNHPQSGELVVWSNTYLKSRIVYIQFGHDNNAYSNPNFRKLLRQSIKWVSN